MAKPGLRNKGESLAHQISDHAAPRSIDDRRDRLISQRSRTDAKWEEAAARLSPAMRRAAEEVKDGSTLEQRAAQARTDHERAGHLSRYETAVRKGRAKPPIVVLTPEAPPRYFLGQCLDCNRELWVHRPKPRVPLCTRCRDKR